MKKHFQTPQEMIEEERGIRVPNGKAAGADDFVVEFSVQGHKTLLASFTRQFVSKVPGSRGVSGGG